MECNLIRGALTNSDIFSKIADGMDNSFVARLKLVCMRFKELSDIYLKRRIISFYKITSLFNESVENALHDVAANILIAGYQNPYLFTSNSGFIGASGYIYNLATGRVQKLLGPCSDKVLFLNFDLSHQIIIGNLESHRLAAWSLDGTLYDLKNDINFEIPKKLLRRCMNMNNSLIEQIRSFKLLKELPSQKEIKSDFLITDRKISHFSIIDSERGWICASFIKKNGCEKIEIFNLNDFIITERIFSTNAHASIYAKEKGCLIYLDTEHSIVVKDIANKKIIRKLKLKTEEKVEKLFYHEKSNKLIIISWIWRKNYGKKVGYEWIKICNINNEKKAASLYSKKKEILLSNALIF
ncbi:MAG: hypothetical protein H0V82_11625 [Candidatus Protochlamydia sp.]|nr:hypothetical protein [Candidatus Protochlamydia sp.]